MKNWKYKIKTYKSVSDLVSYDDIRIFMATLKNQVDLLLKGAILAQNPDKQDFIVDLTEWWEEDAEPVLDELNSQIESGRGKDIYNEDFKVEFNYIWDKFYDLADFHRIWISSGFLKFRKTCPRCGKGFIEFPAISRRDNKTEICSQCGTDEGLFDFEIRNETNLVLKAQKKALEKMWLKKVVK